jgi:pyrroloquinoline quinone biosynthesis protein B
MHVRVLGSAAGGGFPQWNCNCRNCAGVRAGTLRAHRRTQSSIAVSDDGRDWVLVNASPDVLAQIQAFPALQPGRALRDTGIAGVVLMDAQIDHTTGLFMLREGRRLELWCTEPVKRDLTGPNPIFDVLSHYCGIAWHPVKLGERESFVVPGCEGLVFEAFALDSNAPPFSPRRDAPIAGDNIGLSIIDRASGKRLVYAPGLGAIEGHIAARIAEADCALVDGTFWTDDEMIALGISKKRSRDLGHLPQSGPGGMLEQLARFPKPRKVLIHINNTHPILDEDSPERAAVARAGVEVAYDGMEIVP